MLWNGSAAAVQNEGLPIKLVFPKEGGIGWVDNFYISSGAVNVEAAHKMIDFTSPRNAEQISRDTGYLTAVKASNEKFKKTALLCSHRKKTLTVLNGKLRLVIRP